MLTNKQIILGISGGIAAYKSATLCSRLVQAGAVVDVVLTEAAQRFITPLTFQALTHRRVYTDMWDIPSGDNIPHIDLADSADLLVVAPATANTIAKLANGLSDNLLAAIALATPATQLLAPAMETDMWQHPATQANIQKLTSWGVKLIGPAEGRLASGAMGKGRLVEPELMMEAIKILLGRNGDLADRHIVVTAGGTREAIDPVRFITNHSSGKMGYAVAVAARNRGARVTLITSAQRPAPYGIQVIPVDSAQAMCEAVLAHTASADALIKSAAVADFRPDTVANQKIKKSADGTGLTLHLTRTLDVLAEVARLKAEGRGPTLTIGFAAETHDLLANAQSKLTHKQLDLIVANDVTATDAGFGVDTNRVTLLGKDGSTTELPLMSKAQVADEILDRVAAML